MHFIGQAHDFPFGFDPIDVDKGQVNIASPSQQVLILQQRAAQIYRNNRTIFIRALRNRFSSQLKQGFTVNAHGYLTSFIFIGRLV